jgi:hypothetical protein
MHTIQQSTGSEPGPRRYPVYVRGPLDGETAYGPQARYRGLDGQALLRGVGERRKKAGTGVYRLIKVGQELQYVYLIEEGKSE